MSNNAEPLQKAIATIKDFQKDMRTFSRQYAKESEIHPQACAFILVSRTMEQYAKGLTGIIRRLETALIKSEDSHHE